MKNKVEQITFNTENDTVTCVGFIVKETKDKIVIALTKNHDEFMDMHTINKSVMVSRLKIE